MACGEHQAEQRDQQPAGGRPGRARACASTPYRPSQRRPGMQPGPAVAHAVQVEAVQPEAAAEQGEPGRERLASGSAVGRASRSARRGGRVARAEAPFCIMHDVEPAVELPAAALSTPACSKPSARCTPIEPRWPSRRSPRASGARRAASQRASSSASSSRPMPWPARVGGQVDRVLDAEAVGRRGRNWLA